MDACVSIRSTLAPPCVAGTVRKSMSHVWSSVIMDSVLRCRWVMDADGSSTVVDSQLR